MGKPFGPRTLVFICAALMVLLAALAAVQYRWSTRVAAADAQREREHLDSSASLFASEFDEIAGETAGFLENDARTALESHGTVGGTPRLLAEIYYVDFPERGSAQAQKLTAAGKFEPAEAPAWAVSARCTPTIFIDPIALVAPIYNLPRLEPAPQDGVRILRTFGHGPARCFAARIDEGYLRSTLFPQLIRRSFGQRSAQEYNFAVTARSHPNAPIFGAPSPSDVTKSFFSVRPVQLAFGKPVQGQPTPGKTAIYMQRVESRVIATDGPSPLDLFGPGAWELRVAHKDLPLASAFEQTRRRNLLLSLGVEVLLAAAILFLVIATQRAQHLADQKMKFVAGVSHELRSPVSAISMLSRNQADGLVTGTERVKQYGELIHQQSRRLNEMVEQALQYAGIHSGLRRPAKEDIDLPRLIREAVDARRGELERSGFQIEMAIEHNLPPFAGDARLLRTAFENLLSNAEKHAGGGRWIRIGAAYSASERELRIEVEDRGNGIDPADRAEIFEPFARGRAAVEAQIPGSGLGLSLVRSAAEAHRGSVTLVSQPGRGSTFTLHLPI
jgi:signal transduction histidine kinase